MPISIRLLWRIESEKQTSKPGHTNGRGRTVFIELSAAVVLSSRMEFLPRGLS